MILYQRDRNRIEQARARGWSQQFTAAELRVPLELVHRVWAEMETRLHEEGRPYRQKPSPLAQESA